MKNRAVLILVWCLALVAFNVVSHWSQYTDKNALYILLDGIGSMTTPIQLILSAVVITGIAMSKRKPMADR